MFKSTSVLVLCYILFAQATDADTIIYAGALIDGVSDAPRVEVSIVVAEGKFEAIEEGYIPPNPDDTVIDLREHTVMPGLMDMHVHLRIEHSKDSYTERFFMNPSDFVLRATVYAERTLMAGFTTVRDLGDDGVVVKSLKNAINQGWIVGPRIFAAGKSLATTGGHADQTNGLVEEFKGDPGPKEGVVNGAYEAGMKIAFGTDTGVSPHGDNAREFELMVNAGMPPMETIQSATMECAKLLRIEDTLGSVEAGKIADLVAVRGDPLENIGLMRQITFVMKEGVVYRSE